MSLFLLMIQKTENTLSQILLISEAPSFDSLHDLGRLFSRSGHSFFLNDHNQALFKCEMSELFFLQRLTISLSLSMGDSELKMKCCAFSYHRCKVTMLDVQTNILNASSADPAAQATTR